MRGLWECAGCGCQTSVTAGTIFQDRGLLCGSGFERLTTQNNVASALGLQRVLGAEKL